MASDEWEVIRTLDRRIEVLQHDLDGCEADYTRLHRSMETILQMSMPGTRTLDDFVRDMTWINDEARRALGTN